MVFANLAKYGIKSYVWGWVMIRYRRYAAIVAGAYLFFGAIYILISGQMAAAISSTIGDFANIERTKGIIFIACTAIGIYLFVSWQLRVVTRDAAELLRNRDFLLASERKTLASIFAVSIAHDSKDAIAPLFAVLGELRAIRNLTEGDRAKIADFEKRVHQLFDRFSRMREAGLANLAAKKMELELGALVKSTIEMARGNPKVAAVYLELSTPSPIWITGYPTLIHKMLISLLDNAAEAAGVKGKVEVRLRHENSMVTLEVHDDGPGVFPNHRAFIFEPFFTMKQGALGLGLLAVNTCVEAHGGRIEISESDLGGGCFRVIFPGGRV